MDDFENLLESGDATLHPVISESTHGDRVSLLMIQSIVRRYFKKYSYLEVGSHLGGMLPPHLWDPQCGAIVSIDKRPFAMPDVRGGDLEYGGNSTQRMIDGLRPLFNDEQMLKLTTFDADASEVSRKAIDFHPDLIMIDGEHTNQAAIKDFFSLQKFAHDETIFLFHDANIVYDAILALEQFLIYANERHKVLFLDDNVGVVLRGSSVNLSERFSKRARNRTAFLEHSRDYLERRIADHFAQTHGNAP